MCNGRQKKKLIKAKFSDSSTRFIKKNSHKFYSLSFYHSSQHFSPAEF